jgi:hypothetical protein
MLKNPSETSKKLAENFSLPINPLINNPQLVDNKTIYPKKQSETNALKHRF